MSARLSASVDELLIAALERGTDSLETGRYVVTFADGAGDHGIKSLKRQGLRLADARDFTTQATALRRTADADALVLPEIGAAIVGAPAFEGGRMSSLAGDSGILAIEPEYFVFARAETAEYLRGFVGAATAIARDLQAQESAQAEQDVDPLVAGATWGLVKCRVPPSTQTGSTIKVAVLDDGMDLAHPDFAGRTFVTSTFVGQPVQGGQHGTFLTGIACGPKAPAGAIPRYGIGYKTTIAVAKVLNNTGSGTTASVLAGMNWAIANRCPVILLAMGSAAPVQAAYTAAGAAALNKGCVMIASAGGSGGAVGAPANSPTILSVASLDPSLSPSPFSNFGKIEIAAPGRDIFSSVPRPIKYATWSGTSMAAAHVAGCAALWAGSGATLRGTALWNKLLSSARPLPFPPARVGKGLVQAP